MAAGDIKTVVADRFEHKPAVVLDSADDYVLADAHAVARVAANDVVGTYSAWIIVDNVTSGATHTILSAGDNSSVNEFMFLGLVSGLLRVKLEHGGATQFEVKAINKIKPNVWTHIAIVQEGRPILYVNGKKRVMTDITATDLTMWYDELTLTDKSKVLKVIKDDLFAISELGRVELIENANIIECKHKKKVWFELEVTKFMLVDNGMKQEEQII